MQAHTSLKKPAVIKIMYEFLPLSNSNEKALYARYKCPFCVFSYC